MTAEEEKAQELIDKYMYRFRYDVRIYEPLCEAKQCAIIAVDEIIDYHNSLFEAGLKDVHQSLNTPNRLYSDILNPQLKFWQEVKQHLNK